MPRWRARWLLAASAALAANGLFADGAQARPLATVSFKEQRLAVLQHPDRLWDIWFSPYGDRVAYRLHGVAVVDGDKPPRHYAWAFFPTFSPDGSLAYAVRIKDRWHMWHDGALSEPYDSIESFGSPSFTRRGIISYRARRKGRAVLWVGSGLVPACEGVRAYAVSDDGRTVACEVHDGRERFVAVNGQRGEPFDYIDSLTLSPDGKRVVYRANRGGTFGGRSPEPRGGAWYAVIDGKLSPAYDGVGEVVLSHSGRSFAYAARSGRKGVVVTPKGRADAIHGASQLRLRDDGTLAYVAFRQTDRHGPGSGEFHVLSGKRRFGPFDRPVGQLTLGPRGTRCAFLVGTSGPGTLHVDGKPGPRYEGIRVVGFSRDGRTLTFHARDKEGAFVVTGAEAGPRVAGIERVLLGPRGAPAYVARTADYKFQVIAGSAESPRYDYIGPVVFSRDGAQVAFGARSGRELWWRVMKVR